MRIWRKKVKQRLKWMEDRIYKIIFSSNFKQCQESLDNCFALFRILHLVNFFPPTKLKSPSKAAKCRFWNRKIHLVLLWGSLPMLDKVDTHYRH
jgi:hypothetical protein